MRICPISKLPLPPKAHGNKIYHPYAEEEAKHLNNEKSYHWIRNMVNQAKRLDEILAKHYPHSRDTVAISKDILDREGFAWDFNSAMTPLPDNTPVYWILYYGYSVAENQNNLIFIHYGNNPIQQSNPSPGNGEEK